MTAEVITHPATLAWARRVEREIYEMIQRYGPNPWLEPGAIEAATLNTQALVREHSGEEWRQWIQDQIDGMAGSTTRR